MTLFNSTNVQNVQEFVTTINVMSGNVFGVLLMFAFWIGFFVMFKKEDDIKDLIVSSYATTLFALLLFFMGWLPWTMAAIPAAAFVASLTLGGFK